MSRRNIFVGYIVSPLTLNNISIINGYICVEDGKITRIGTKFDLDILKSDSFTSYDIVQLKDGELLIPGFVDCHTHAPQFPNIGLGLDRPLLQWLDKYTFPLESQYHDEEFASNVYNQVVKRLLKNGTTTACYFGSIHLNGTMQLVHAVAKHKQRALVGKVSMDIKNDANYFNETEKEVEETEDFLKQVYNIKNDLIQPVITPRFALSCCEDLLRKLGNLAIKYNCFIQSHISETLGEIEAVSRMFPDVDCYANVYGNNKLLTNKCIMAHAVHLKDKEIEIFQKRGVAIAHCPASNTRLMSGLCPLRKILYNGIKVGLGTDVSGGDSASILDAMRRAMDVSAHLQLQGSPWTSLSWKEVFYLATLGGAKALNLDQKIGNFEVGKEFDALIINVYGNSQIDHYNYPVCETNMEYAENLLQRFIYLGDERNINKVYVKGVKI